MIKMPGRSVDGKIILNCYLCNSPPVRTRCPTCKHGDRSARQWNLRQATGHIRIYAIAWREEHGVNPDQVELSPGKIEMLQPNMRQMIYGMRVVLAESKQQGDIAA